PRGRLHLLLLFTRGLRGAGGGPGRGDQRDPASGPLLTGVSVATALRRMPPPSALNSERAFACVLGDTDLLRALSLAGIRCAVAAAPGSPPRYSRLARVALDWADAWEQPALLLELLERFGAAPLDLRFPGALKPLVRRGERWDPIAAGAKALRLDSPLTLVTLWPRLAVADVPVLLQELIPGPETRVESYHVYVDERGALVG